MADVLPIEDRTRLFLAELAVLREAYSLEIGGCGECGSPWVRDVSDGEMEADVGWFLGWDSKVGSYVFRQGTQHGF